MKIGRGGGGVEVEKEIEGGFRGVEIRFENPRSFLTPAISAIKPGSGIALVGGFVWLLGFEYLFHIAYLP